MVPLEMRGHSVIAVEHADVAVEAAITHDFDLAILEVTEPVFRGLKAVNLIRAARPYLKIAIYSAMDDGRSVDARSL